MYIYNNLVIEDFIPNYYLNNLIKKDNLIVVKKTKIHKHS